MTITMYDISELRKKAYELYQNRLNALVIVGNMIRESPVQNDDYYEGEKTTAIHYIKEAIKSLGDKEFTMSDIHRIIPNIKKKRIEQVLYKLKKNGKIFMTVEKYGSRPAKYQVIQDEGDIKSDD